MMTKKEVKVLLKQAQKNKQIIHIYFRFDKNCYNLIPLISNEKFFLCINENDFMLDGFSIFRIKDIKKIEIDKGFYSKILKEEALIDNIQIFKIDIKDWKCIFQDLKEMNKNIIIEKQTVDYINNEFIIGKIDKIYNHFVYVWHFNIEGIWEKVPIKIPYTEITNVIFSSRYIDIFSKYIEKSADKKIKEYHINNLYTYIRSLS